MNENVDIDKLIENIDNKLKELEEEKFDKNSDNENIQENDTLQKEDNMFENIKENIYLKKIQPEVDEKLMKMDLLKIENGKKIYARGSCTVMWQIQKKLMKEKFNIDWKSPQDKNPDILFD